MKHREQVAKFIWHYGMIIIIPSDLNIAPTEAFDKGLDLWN